MKKYIYIIPGFEETSRRKPYQLLAKIAKAKGYQVAFRNVDWAQKLSSQIFPVTENSIIFGFSLGAVLARLVAQGNPCKHLILASMTPLVCFRDKKMKKGLVDLLGSEYVDDVKKNLFPHHQALKQTVIYGDKEEESGDILVPNTEHELSAAYIKEIAKLM